MQAIDEAAIRGAGIPRLLLMEHAGLAVARSARALTPSTIHPIVICCGSGFNGGDGLSAARHLHGWGYPVRLLLIGRPEALREEPATYATIAQRLGIPLAAVTDSTDLSDAERWLTGCGLIIDALLGIGGRGPVREPAASLIARMNRSGRPILAVDVPSGLDADTGAVQGIAVKASATVTFGVPKQGCLLAEGPAHTGVLTVDPITIPSTLLEAAP